MAQGHRLIVLVTLTTCLSCASPEENLIFHHELKVPCENGGMPNLYSNDVGEVYLSWVSFLNETEDALMFSKLEHNQWAPPMMISKGDNWFTNWADFPSLVTSDDGGNFAAHWLQKSDLGTYDYDIRISQSVDKGATWSTPFTLHRDSIAAEHGFVSIIPQLDDTFLAVWLDGRNTKSSNGTDHDLHGIGPMTLRSAIFDEKAVIGNEIELDSMVCDCCQTSVTNTENGVIVAYRDRSNDEIRDIATIRVNDGIASVSNIVHNDQWKIDGCPVNGPSIDAVEENVAVAWFSNQEQIPEVKVAFSKNLGQSFDDPILISKHNTLGRVDIKWIDNNKALVVWMDVSDTGADIKIVKIGPRGLLSSSYTVATTSSARASGFPQLTITEKQAIIAWTYASENETYPKSAVLDFNLLK